MRMLMALLAVLPLASLAAETAVPPINVGSQVAQILLGLLLIIGLILGLAWLVRRMQQVGPKSNQVIKLVAIQHLGPRERLVLVQVGQEQVLVGLTAGRITPLHVMQEPVRLAEEQPASPEFAQRLFELISREPKDKL
ncbi:flagellar protein FliO/FliZ [Pseudomonas duriflava]|uniref:Flagellar protein n=1 Tax=Pseudomonas duriflava TaxID=459528 RepID=A0A562QB27_9PSED|nr:flagellar biosynthetic protein FliO [Pseudomonas duriflava]TWI53913.1 flagellar protein FliO/FliZ [Pseudomonas duriflava]